MEKMTEREEAVLCILMQHVTLEIMKNKGNGKKEFSIDFDVIKGCFVDLGVTQEEYGNAFLVMNETFDLMRNKH